MIGVRAMILGVVVMAMSATLRQPILFWIQLSLGALLSIFGAILFFKR